ncbi:MAG: universal stress protein [Deltaproteobacteria bacterium]|nr:universal stress protein [Deltaproteobacteria bacterium]
MKSIVIGMDGSPASQAALKEAVEWSRVLGAELRGVFIEDEQRFVTYPAGLSAEGGVPISVPLSEGALSEENAKVKREGDTLEQAFTAACKGLKTRTRFIRRRGDVNDLMTQHARSSDLVVLGRRGFSEGVAGRKPGPTTETLIHQALRPVLVVPEKPRRGKGALFAYDGSRGVQRVLVPGSAMASAMGGPALAIAIGVDSAQEAFLRETVLDYWKAWNLQGEFSLLPKKDRVSATIVEAARNKGHGLIIMGAFGHNPLRELFFGSTTLEVLEQSDCPVLLMA